MDIKSKMEIIETLWQIIYSNKDADILLPSFGKGLRNPPSLGNTKLQNAREKIR